MTRIRLPAVGLAVIVGSLLGAAVEASPIVVDFSSGAPGPIGTTFTASGLTVEAFYLTGGVWTPTQLFRRNDAADDLGFGVCNPGETANCGTGSGFGDYNELSNLINPELIRLTLPAGYEWVSADVSSADTNASASSAAYERGQLWASASGTPSTTPGSLFGGAPVWQITGASPNQTFSGFTASNNTSAYLFFEAYDWLNGTNPNNDYLIHSVTLDTSDITTTQVPEPTLLTLLGGGMAALWRARRRSGPARRRTVAAK